jgi:5'-3' exonuclease
LNCAIYYCVRKVQTRLPYETAIRARWERALIDSVIAYIKQLDAIVQPTETLYVAVDGVAPFAKIRQQRARRFKSAIAAAQEAAIVAEARGVPYDPAPRWDTNAITPGTQFMEALTDALRAYARSAPSRIVVSPADEPGEGEQKIMSFLRNRSPRDAVVYGLDADLIVLALWGGATTNTRVDLFREETEFNGAVKTNAIDEEQYLYLDIQHLAAALYAAHGRHDAQTPSQFICDFVGLMNVLGNDFCPHGMTLKIRDEGVEKVLESYSALTTSLVDPVAARYNVAALRALFAAWAADEPTALLRGVVKKLTARVGRGGASNEERALAAYQDTPVALAAEKCLVKHIRVPDKEKPQYVLRDDWKAAYDAAALMDASPAEAAAAYLDALAWTLAYYAGHDIDAHWYYAWLLPPRAETIAQLLETQPAMEPPATKRRAIKPQEQLAMVLPATSYDLLPREYSRLVCDHPHAFPTDWGYYSFGRRFMWECEPLIPLIYPAQIVTWIEELYE